MTDKRDKADIEQPKVEEYPCSEGLSRRDMLQRAGKFSAAVVALIGGGATLSGCDPYCNNTCAYANDGDCDDGGDGSDYSLCEYGSDCNDCGPRDGSDYSDYSYSDYSYSDYSYSDYSYSDYYSDYYNYADYYSNYYNYYDNYFANSW